MSTQKPNHLRHLLLLRYNMSFLSYRINPILDSNILLVGIMNCLALT